jgi:hypothetical protein
MIIKITGCAYPRKVTGKPFRQKAANVIIEATLKRLPPPTLLITGEADLYWPPALIRTLLLLGAAGGVQPPPGLVRCSCHPSQTVVREDAGQEMRDMCSPPFERFLALGHELVPLVHCGYTGDRS